MPVTPDTPQERSQQLRSRASDIFIASRDARDVEQVARDLKEAKTALDDAKKNNDEAGIQAHSRKLELLGVNLTGQLNAEQKKKSEEQRQVAAQFNPLNVLGYLLDSKYRQQYTNDVLKPHYHQTVEQNRNEAANKYKFLKQLLDDNEKRKSGISTYDTYGSSMGSMFEMATTVGEMVAAMMPWAGLGDAVWSYTSTQFKNRINYYRTAEEKPLSIPEIKYFVEVDKSGRLSLDAIEKNIIKSDGSAFTSEQIAQFYGAVIAWLKEHGYEPSRDQSGGYEMDNNGLIQIGKKDASGNFTPISKQDFIDLRDNFNTSLQSFLQRQAPGTTFRPGLGSINP